MTRAAASRDGTPDVYPAGPRALARTRLAAARGVRSLFLTSNGAGRHPDAVTNTPTTKESARP